jgi:hypothetical integral membrane protein (TIGR02206 family)
MPLFGPVHLAIIALIAAVCWTLAVVARRRPARAPSLRIALGLSVAVNEIIWYFFRYSREGFRFPEGLPLQLCDLTVWLCVFACLTRNRPASEFLYFAGLGGAVLAILMPDLWAPCPSYPAVYFFLAHGGVVAGTALLIFGRQAEIVRGSMWRAFAVLNAYVLVVGAFNAVFGTNYVYLCRKPESASLLDWFGPWPVYILAAEVFALGLFALLSLPFRESWRHASGGARRAGAGAG